MPRTFVTADRTRLAGDYNVYTRVEVQNSAGTWIDLTAYTGGRNYFVEARWAREIDQPIMSGTLTFLREVLGTSLAPLIVGSPLNTVSASYSPLIRGGAAVRISTNVAAFNVAPVSGDWREMFLGRIDDPDWGGDDGTMTVTISDLGAWLLGKNMEVERVYGTSGGVALQTVMQAIINDNPSGPLVAINGGVNITLSVPISPGWNIKSYTQQKTNVLEALRTLAAQIGWDVRFQYDASNNYVLTLFQPNRAKSVADYTLGVSAYYAIPKLEQNLGDVRTKIGGSYLDATTKTRLTRTVQADAAHTTQYDIVYMEVDEADSSNIDSSTEMDKMLNAILSDLQDSAATAIAEAPYFWIMELGDLVTLTSNTVHFNQDQSLAVVSFEHLLNADGEQTTLTVRGKVAGSYKLWLAKQGNGSGGLVTDAQPPQPSLSYASQSITSVVLNLAAFDNAHTGAMSWITRLTVGGVPGAWSAIQTTALPTTLNVNRDLFYSTLVEFQVTQGDGQSAIATLAVHPRLPSLNPSTGAVDHQVPYSDGQIQASTRDAAHAGGTATNRQDDDLRRAGQGGLPLPRGRIITDPLYEPTGATALIDTVARQFHSSIQYPNGLDDMTEPGTYKRTTLNEKTGGGRGFTALDAGSILIAGSADFSRSYTNSNLRYVLDDATSNRNAGTANQITGGGRGFTALDSGNVLVAGSADFSRAYANSNLRYVLDDATSNRNAGTANQITGGGRGFSALDASNILLAASADLSRGYTNSNLRYVLDDATSNRNAGTANQITGGGRGFSAIDSGGVLVAASIDFIRGYTNKHLGNIPDDGTSDRRAVNLNQQTGAGRGFIALDSTNKLTTGVSGAATAADGVAGIESTKGSNTRAAHQSGHGVSRVSEDSRRSNLGGVPVRGSAFDTLPIYDPTGAQLILDPSNTGALSALRTLTSIKDRVQMKMSGAQVIGSGSLTKLTMDVAFFDIGAGMADTTNRRIVIPADHVGLFVFHLNLGWTASATGYRRARIQDTGVAYVADNSTGNAGAVLGTNVDCWLFVDSPAAGTAFEAYGDQGSGSSQNAVAIFECFRLW